MITLNFDVQTGIAKLAQSNTIKRGADVPVRVVFSEAPGELGGLQLALGSDADAPAILAYTDTFTSENDLTWTALLDASDTRLATFMTGKGTTAVNLELVAILDGEKQVTPNLSVTVQNPIITGDPTSEGGPSYYTEAEVDALLAGYAPRTVATKYRIKNDGTFQLWNATQSKWHALTITGAAGAEVLAIGAGES